MSSLSSFETAFAYLLKVEGGFVDHANDGGGPTNMGLTLRFLQALDDADGDGWLDGDLDRDGDVDIHDVLAMTPEDARAIYRRQFWERYELAALQPQEIATTAFEFSVWMGPGRAVRLLQSALNAAGVDDVVVDGGLGPITRRAVNDRVNPRYLIVGLRAASAEFLGALVRTRALLIKRGVTDRNGEPLKPLDDFLVGWLKRAYAAGEPGTNRFVTDHQ